MEIRYKSYNPEQCYFNVIDPKDIKANNPLLNVIYSFIIQHVDLEMFNKKVKNESNGASAINPIMLLNIIFYAYAQGIYTSRKIEDRLNWDPNFIFLSGQQKVDHSSICNFILKYKDEIQEIFSKLIYILTNKGLVDLNFVAIDGTKIKASASKDFTGSIEDFKKKKNKIEKRIDQLLQNTVSDTNEKQNDKKSKKLKKLEKEKDKIENFLSEVEEMNTNRKTKFNLTDKDTTVVKDKREFYAGFNCQGAVDAQNHFIVAPLASNASDQHLLKPMVEQTQMRSQNSLQNSELAFDAGYFTSDNLQYIESKKLNVYMPEGHGLSGEKRNNKDTITARNCKILNSGVKKKLECPGGHIMETNNLIKDRDRFIYYFYPKKDACKTCDLEKKCYKHIKSRKKFHVDKKVYDSYLLREKMLAKISSDEGQINRCARFATVEHVFGEIKELYGFRQFYHRSLEKVNLIWTMICMAYNFRKLAKIQYA
jgi:transposase